jgi:hypothetical protein
MIHSITGSSKRVELKRRSGPKLIDRDEVRATKRGNSILDQHHRKIYFVLPTKLISTTSIYLRDTASCPTIQVCSKHLHRIFSIHTLLQTHSASPIVRQHQGTTDLIRWDEDTESDMSNTFIGLTMLVTLSSPPGAQLRGVVSGIEPGKSLTLRNGKTPHASLSLLTDTCLLLCF